MQQDLATAKAAFALAETTLGNLASLLVAPASSQVAPPQQLDVVAEEDEVAPATGGANRPDRSHVESAFPFELGDHSHGVRELSVS